MSHKVQFPPPGFDELSIEEKIDYVTAPPDKVPVPDWHQEIIAERLAQYSDGKGGLQTDGWKTWEEIEAELSKH